MHLRSDSFTPYATMSEQFAFGKHDPDQHCVLSDNQNPHLQWSGAPDTTRSFVVLCWDPDVPTVGDDVNQAGKSVPLDLPRCDFFHWVLVDIPPHLGQIGEGSRSSGVSPRGKTPGVETGGGVTGINDYTGWFASDPDMSGDYGGYDGPCPPFNDERMHGYHFAVYALDVASLKLSGSFTGAQVREAMKGHVLASATLVGLYAINPQARR